MLRINRTTNTPVTIVKISLLTTIRIIPSLAYFIGMIYLYNHTEAFNYSVHLTNLLFIVFLTIFPSFMFRCEHLTFTLFFVRTLKELADIESPSQLEFDNLEKFMTSFSSWFFECSFWFTLLMKFVLLMYQVIKAVRDHETNEPECITSQEDQRLLDDLPMLKYRDYQSPCRETGRKNFKSECAICLEAFKEDDDLIPMTKCDHVFHKTCIRKWFLLRINCPYCRKEVLPEKQPEVQDANRIRNLTLRDFFTLPFLELPLPSLPYPSFRLYT